MRRNGPQPSRTRTRREEPPGAPRARPPPAPGQAEDSPRRGVCQADGGRFGRPPPGAATHPARAQAGKEGARDCGSEEPFRDAAGGRLRRRREGLSQAAARMRASRRLRLRLVGALSVCLSVPASGEGVGEALRPLPFEGAADPAGSGSKSSVPAAGGSGTGLQRSLPLEPRGGVRGAGRPSLPPSLPQAGAGPACVLRPLTAGAP